MVFLASSSMLCVAYPGFNLGWAEPCPEPVQEAYFGLFPGFYDFTCPPVDVIVMSVVEKAVADDPRVAASLLRLHFHDCFVQGCDASFWLGDSEIKARLEQVCLHAAGNRIFVYGLFVKNGFPMR
ncbi:hypothetical protein V2J09_023774 [Rumex salicifolius]